MRFGLSKALLDFFYQRRYIEFENLISEDLRKKLLLEQEALFEKKKIDTPTTPRVYQFNHNLFLSEPEFRKVALSFPFAEIASQLMKKKSVRIAFDQLLWGTPSDTPLFPQPLTLVDLSSIYPVLCGLIITLRGGEFLEEPQPKEGNITFFSPKCEISFDYLNKGEIVQYLIVYTEDKALYLHNPSDLHTHSLKRQGLAFGDRLGEAHPLILKPY